MSVLLDAVHAERQALLAPIADRLATLDEIERLAHALNGGTQPSADGDGTAATVTPAAVPADPPAAPPSRALPAATPATRRGRDGLSKQGQVALEKLRAAGQPLSRVEIGASPDVMSTLVKRKLVEAIGDNRGRKYRPLHGDDDDAAGRAGAAPRSLPAPAAVVPDGAAAGLLHPNAARVLRARILDHCSRRRLSEQDLVDHLNAEREHVADIVGKLLLEDAIVLEPDGRYRVPA